MRGAKPLESLSLTPFTLECFKKGVTLFEVHFTKIIWLLCSLWADGEAEGPVSVPLHWSRQGSMVAWTRRVVMEMRRKEWVKNVFQRQRGRTY